MCHGSILAAWGSFARPAALTKALLRRTAGFVLGRWLRAGGFARLPVVGRPASARHEIGTPDFRSGYAGSYAQEELTLYGGVTRGKPPYDLRPMCGWRPCGCPCGFPAAVRGACGRVSTHAALGSFSFARRRKIGRERRQKRLAILAKNCYYEDRSLHAKRLFQWSLHPSRSPGTGTKLINLYKYYITKWCAYGLNAAVERRGSARQRQTIPTKDRDGKSSEKTP
mgnify:CR=1 FL=1